MTHPSSLDLEAFACGEEISPVTSHLGACDDCRAFVTNLRALPPPRAVDVRRLVRTELRRKVWATTSIAVPLAAAAVLLLFLRTPTTAGEIPTPIPTAEPSAAAAPFEPGTSFKGRRQVAVIRERDGEQQRFTDRVRVREGDRLRVEVAIDREQAILAAVVGEDGSYLEMMPSAVRAPGTHYSEKSARVSGPPSNGKIVVGGESLADAPTEIRIEWETR